MTTPKSTFFHRYILIIILTALLVVVIINTSRDESLQVKAFDVNTYQHFIEPYPFDENIGPAFDVTELVEKAEEIWIREYGEDIKEEKPYQVFYDMKNELWLVHGTFHRGLFGPTMGGVSYILVDRSGKVISVWHDR